MKRILSFERAIRLEINGIGRFMAATSVGLLDVGLDLAGVEWQPNSTFGIDFLTITLGGVGAVGNVGINVIGSIFFDV